MMFQEGWIGGRLLRHYADHDKLTRCAEAAKGGAVRGRSRRNVQCLRVGRDRRLERGATGKMRHRPRSPRSDCSFDSQCSRREISRVAIGSNDFTDPL